MSNVDSAAPHVADALVRFLGAKPDGITSVAELPEHLRAADLLTVADADGIIEFGHRDSCYVGPEANRELRIDGDPDPRRWRFSRRSGQVGGSMDRFLAAVLAFDGDDRIREHVRLTAAGRVRASRLRLVRDDAKAESDAPLDDLVTLDQAAAVVCQSKRTLERFLQRQQLPRPDFPGGGGKSHRWYWRNLRPALQEHFRPDLPERYPASRIVG